MSIQHSVVVSLLAFGSVLGSSACDSNADERPAPAMPPAAAAQVAPPAAQEKDSIFRIDPANVAAALRYDSATRTVTYPLVSALTSRAGGWNFNGYARGEMTIVVPLGARVIMPYLNQDIVPHSAGVVEGSLADLSALPQKPAFPGAETHQFQRGLRTGETSDLRFTADKAGTYLLICGVPGHATSGMWIYFEVSADAERPEIRITA